MQTHHVRLNAAGSSDDPVIGMIRSLADEARRGIYLYRSFDEEPTFCSYRELYRRIAGCMELFRASGIEHGTRVLLPFDTSIDTISSFLALIGVGAMTFSVKPWDARGGQEARSYIEMVCRRYRITHAVRSLNSGPAGLPVDEPPIKEIIVPSDAVADDAAFASVPPSDVALIQFSSGSTSLPKGVPVTREALDEHLKLLVAFDGRRPEDVFVSWLPLYHDLGLIMGMLTSLYGRNDLHLVPPFSFIRAPLGWLNLMSERRATHSVTAYFAINYCLNHLDQADEEDIAAAAKNWNFESLRFFLIGSDPTDYDRTLEFQGRLEPYGFRRGALLPAYGMAEAPLVVSATRVEDEPWAHTLEDGRKLVSTGGVLPGFEVRITREDGTPCDEGELGQIEMRGSTVTAGYFEEPTIPFYNKDGYFETGDLAYSIRGELVIAGRTGDRIKINGQSLFASDFEFSVQSLSFIRHGRAVVFQIDQKTILLAEVPGEGALTAHEQRAAIRDAIAKRLGVKLPLEDIRLIAPGQIKKTSSGKLKRRAMAQAFIDGTIRFAKHEASASESTAVRVREVSHA